MAQFQVPVTIDGKQMMVPVEAPDAATAKRAVEQKYGRQQSAPTQGSRYGEVFGAGAAVGIADTIDMLLTPVTGAIYLGRKALGDRLGGLPEDSTFFGDEGFADLSGAISRGAEEQLGALTKTEDSVMNFGRVTGGVASGLGVGGAIRSAGATTIRQLGQRGVQSGMQHGTAKGFEWTGRMLAEQPLLQVTAGVAGEGARQVAAANDAGPIGQIGAAVLGSLTPAGAQFALRRLTVGGAARREALAAARKGQDIAIDFIDTEISQTREYIEHAKELDEVIPLQPLKDELKELLHARKALKQGVVATPNEGVMEILRRVPGAAGAIEKRAQGLAEAVRLSIRQEGPQGLLHALEDPDLARFIGLADESAAEIAGLAGTSLINQARHSASRAASGAYEQFMDNVETVLSTAGLPHPTLQATNSLNAARSYLSTVDVGMLPPEFRTLLDKITEKMGSGTVSLADLASLRRAIGQQLGDPSLNPALPRKVLAQIDEAMYQDLRAGIAALNEPTTITRGQVLNNLDQTERAVLDAVERRGLHQVDAADDGAIINAMTQDQTVDLSVMTLPERNAYLQGQLGDGRAFIEEYGRIVAAGQARAAQTVANIDVGQLVTSLENARSMQMDTIALQSSKLAAVTDSVRSSVGVNPTALFDAIAQGSVDSPTLVRSISRIIDDLAENSDDILTFDFNLQGARMTGRVSPEEAMGLLQHGFIERLGQTAGGKFDLEVFLKNWGSIDERAAKVLFEEATYDRISSLAKIAAKAAERSKRVEGIVTPFRVGIGSLGVGGAAQLLTGGAYLGPAFGALMATYAGSRATISLLSKPWFIDWMIKSASRPNVPPAAIIDQLHRAINQHAETPEEKEAGATVLEGFADGAAIRGTAADEVTRIERLAGN